MAGVSASSSRPPRVLLGNLDPMARLGMSRLLAEDGVEVVERPDPPDVQADIVEDARELHPDAVVLRLENGETTRIRELVSGAVPGTKVILWARDETEMQVYDPGSSVPRRMTAGPDALLDEIRHDTRARQGE
jgi:AmiR/NasT family two-component response regulator